MDHPPFPAAASELAKAFGVEFRNGVAIAGHWRQGNTDTFDYENGLKESAVTRGRADDEKITKVRTFGGSASASCKAKARSPRVCFAQVRIP